MELISTIFFFIIPTNIFIGVITLIISECECSGECATCACGQCIPSDVMCDGYVNCIDGSDEDELCGRYFSSTVFCFKN